MIVLYVFIALVLLRVVLIAIGAALIIQHVSACPACFQESVGVRYHWLKLMAPWLEWRWCPSCGWQGPSRRLQ
ncbi:MAG: hypothetical protein WEE89_03505 [Gemmatimonadota bacterium]